MIYFNPFMPNELFYKHSLDRSISNIRGVWLVFIICASNPKRFGLQMHYYRLTMWPVMCVTTNVLVQQTLGWFGAYPEKTISVPWLGRDYWHVGRADNSNKTANNAKYSKCRGLNHATYDVSLQNLWSPPFWILSPLRILFLSILSLFIS